VTAHLPVGAAPSRVSTLELFFDLVFVFTITQVTEIIVDHPDAAGLSQAAIVLFVIFWMYGGYAWLTNASEPDTAARRLVLLGAMAAFFLASLSVPDAFGANGVAFGLAYLAVNVVHAIGFVVFAGLDALRPVLRLFGCNLISAGLVLAAGWVHGSADWVLWLAAVAVQLATPALAQTRRNYRINVEHFTERHGLVILIVLGESLINVALAEAHAIVTFRTAVGVFAGLLAAATIWWSYFVGDDDQASAALAAASPQRRAALAITGYFFAHLVMIYGILVLAAGIGLSAPDLTASVDTADAWLIAGGVAIFLIGSGGFRAALGYADPRTRIVGGVCCLAAVPVGLVTSAAVELVIVAAIVALTLAADARIARSSGASGAGRRAGWADPTASAKMSA
jgi:low temperature requirement protein LtrA